jgi:FdhD protein
MKRTEQFDILKLTIKGIEQKKDVVTVEEPLTLFLNGKELVTLLYSPSHAEQLAVGFLFSEGIIRKSDDIEGMRFYEGKGVVNIDLKENGAPKDRSASRLVTSGCAGGTSFYRNQDLEDLSKISSKTTFNRAEIIALMREMGRRSNLFRETGGVHSSALARKGELVLFREDIGRHNAIDKIIGECFLQEIPFDDALLMTSGRISSEIARKAGITGIPVIVSRSAPTSLALRMAKELDLTIVGFARGKRMNIYTSEWRIV